MRVTGTARAAMIVVVVVVVAVAVAIAGLTACTSGRAHSSMHSSARSRSAPSRAVAILGAAGCRPASPIASTANGPEIRGTAHGGSLFGLVQTSRPAPITTGESVKIVWRMTGAGSLRLGVKTPSGRAGALQWGPEPHSGSNYNRPGQEWGAGYEFASPGCWRLHAARTGVVADVWLRVVSG